MGDFGRLAVGVGGAAIGFAISGGNPAGAALGFNVGSFAGGLLFGEQEVIFGPRAEPRAPNVRVYGESIPFTYGGTRVRATPIWSGGIEERFAEEEQGKKGGKKGPIEVSFWTEGSWAVLLSEGSIGGVHRIWWNGKVVLDNRPSSTVGRRPGLNFRLYKGSETQLPDPTIEEKEGVGNVTAHRGTAYIVFVNQVLTDFGNTFPIVEVEIVHDKVVVPVVLGMHTAGDFDEGSVRKIAMLPTEPAVYAYSGEEIVKYDTLTNDKVVDSDGLSQIPKQQFPDILGGVGQDTWSLGSLRTTIDGELYGLFDFFDGGSNPRLVVAKIDPDSLQITKVSGMMGGTLFTGMDSTHPLVIWVWHNFGGGMWAMSKGLPLIDDPGELQFMSWHGALQNLPPPVVGFGTSSFGPWIVAVVVDRNGDAWALVGVDSFIGGGDVTGGGLFKVDRIGGGVQKMLTPSVDLSLGSRRGDGMRYDPLNDVFLIYGSSVINGQFGPKRLITVDRDTLEIIATRDIILTDFDGPGNYQPILAGRTWVTSSTPLVDPENPESPAAVGMVELDVLTLDILRLEGRDPLTFSTPHGIYDWWHDGAVSTGDIQHTEEGPLLHWFFGKFDLVDTTLDLVVADLMRRANYEPADYDVTSLVSTNVRGYVVGRRTTVRAMIEPLALAFHFDAVESDFKIKFVRRGTAPTEVIRWEDLGAHVGGSDAPPRIAEIRLGDLEAPLEIDVKYFDVGRDYEQGMQPARRIFETDALNGSGTQKATALRSIELPIVFNANEARDVAWRLLAQAWSDRVQYEIALPPKYIHLDPTDIVSLETVENDTMPPTIRIDKLDYGKPGIIKISATVEDTAVYGFNNVVPGETGPGFDSPTIVLPAPVTAIIMDIPSPDDEHADQPLIFIALTASDGGRFSGGIVWKSVDLGASYNVSKLIGVRTPQGSTISKLAAPLRDNWAITDDNNTVDVHLVSEDSILESVTDLQLWRLQNMALVGDEIIQFGEATQLSAREWRLSHLIRGRRGTENEIDTHNVGDRFCLLDIPSVSPEGNSVSNIGSVFMYRATILGVPPVVGRVTAFAYQANNLRNPSPAYLEGSRNVPSSEDWTITWMRRSRSVSRFPKATVPPLQEDAETYELDFLDGNGDVVVTKTVVGASSFVYTAAAQDNDFSPDGAQATLVVRIQQVGVAGRGFPRQETLTE